ncbi:MAG: prepilin peptidase [Candidatus Rokubacteria bacterium]|nr:prepilin peptidase [Candidatus Rokubacteria bacterium]
MIFAGAFLFGAVMGSFLNVCASRLPRGASLWRPGSACPACAHPIRWHDNVPLLSFLILRGRCRDCRAPIGWRYPAVELGTALLFALAYAQLGLRGELALALVFVSALMVVTVIDLEHQLIPDRITLPVIAAGFLGSAATGQLSWLDSLLGILVGGGIIYAIIQGSRLVMGVEGMGGGDITLAAMVGAFLGWKLLLLGLFLAVLVGAAVAMALLASGRKGGKDPIPFGPFLALGGAVSLFWGKEILQWYLKGFLG